MSDSVRRMIPNLLTLARVGLAGCFFAIVAVALWPKQGAGSDLADRQFWGNVAVVIFVVAAITDYVDGLLARRWKVVSVFGRVMDPFGDKLLVIGAFVFLASPAFLKVAPVDGGVYLFVPFDAAGNVEMTTVENGRWCCNRSRRRSPSSSQSIHSPRSPWASRWLATF